MYLLFDCNNFFASCEQVFRPDWRRRPLVVLSNNDGCVISRSPEAKAMGIAMGEPLFKCRERLERANAVICSANFALYSDLSDRIMGILEEDLPSCQQYSVDEAFAQVDDKFPIDWVEYCRKLRQKIARWTGVTVSVGLAPTRTLAKLANERAKKDQDCEGVLALLTPERIEPMLQATPVEDVWGVGRKLAPRMRGLGIRTAAGLAGCSLDFLRKQFGVHGERLALELRGISCLDEVEPPARTQIMVSRTLKEGVHKLDDLKDAIRLFVEKAGRILRTSELMASELAVVLRTSRFEESGLLYARELGCRLPFPSDDTRVLTRHAMELLEKIYRPGYPFRKTGVILLGLQPVSAVQPTFDHPVVQKSKLMEIVDSLQRAGMDIHFGPRRKEKLWSSAYTSPCYTTSWKEIPECW